MLTINETLLKPISVGYVANNKLRNTIDIEVVMAETTPFVSGELVSGVTALSVDGVNSKGEAQTFAIQTTNAIRAEWLGDSTNRITPPDVRRAARWRSAAAGTLRVRSRRRHGMRCRHAPSVR